MSEILIKAATELNEQLDGLQFSEPVTHVYNPLVYAWDNYQTYLQRFAQGSKKVLFLGMNPGPWGMAQVGIPFGEVSLVKNWMGICGAVNKPKNEHPKRPITGFDCTRSEVSGKRLWGLFSEVYPDANDFFTHHYVHNFCPLVWMADTGRNITPDKLSKSEMQPVEAACRQHLAKLIEQLQPEFLIGVGAFAEKQLKNTLKEYLPEYKATLGRILHPSPASPAANRGWPEAATAQLIEQGIWSS